MGKITGFLEIDRATATTRRSPIASSTTASSSFRCRRKSTATQAARCMDCGIPYLSHRLPGEQPDPGLERPRLSRRLGRGARNLHSTNNFPEFTGRVCPAPCEASCTLNINDNPVTIKTIECAIVDRALREGWIKPEPPTQKTGKTVAVDRLGPGRPGLRAAARPRRP